MASSLQRTLKKGMYTCSANTNVDYVRPQPQSCTWDAADCSARDHTTELKVHAADCGVGTEKKCPSFRKCLHYVVFLIFKKRFRFLQRLFGVMNDFSNEQCTDAPCRAIARRQRLFLARNEKSKIRERKGSERKIQNLLGRAGRCKQIAHNQASRGERLRTQRNRILNLPFQNTLLTQVRRKIYS